MNLYDYSISVITNNVYLHFFDLLLESLKKLNFDFSNFYLGDVGIDNVERYNYLNIIDLPIKKYSNTKTQTNGYRQIISNRTIMLNNITDVSDKPILQLDADTYIVKSLFNIDSDSDITITIRNVIKTGLIKKFSYRVKRYPNLGVVFWNKPNKCRKFWSIWDKIRKTISAHQGQYEQNSFLHAMESKEYKDLKSQEVPCYQYNCYDSKWLKHKPSIIHFKGCEGRDVSKKLPNKKLLEYCRI